MSEPDEADVLVLGAGSGGYACALRAAQLGLRVTLVEKDKVGGTCLHAGCIPTKAMLHAAEIADTARHSASVGVDLGEPRIDMGRVAAYRQGVVDRLFKGLTGLIAGRGIDVVAGEGRVVDAHTVAVGDRMLRGRHLVLATGSVAKTIPSIPLSDKVITSDGALALTAVPRRVAVLGGGVIGVEFASVLRSFGAEVTIVEALPRLVAAEDEALSAGLQRAFRQRGIATRLGASVSGVSESGDGIRLEVDGDEPVEADLLLVAVGRGPAPVPGIENLAVETDRGYVPVDERCRTTVEGVYAVGDLVPGLQLAHRGFAQGILVAEVLAGLGPAPIVESGIPRVTYCDPEVASVGLTEAAAREKYGEVETVEYNLAGNGKSQILQTKGFVKLVRAKDGPVVGVHMLGARVGEQIGEAQLIVGWQAHPEDVAPLVHAHPTQNEALGEAHLALAGKPLHAHA
ncbi:Dihydrolipoyl dehydrogenase (E3 subunit of both pyruvate dehydrogenase and 2-oxoglutarate dehydrogenase complexes) [Nostocoides australiense Ben110]|uniref:Dihydrolipoyl dehydrogenase n=1 Tax=Nostocoides australiense Ben110 TaxID=1193182 RepID=W6JSR2_9MICO|nr:dihydrolipoyl dehydrogenase [Tetrasphaera australiensis]CCH71662.1 Dihydrolipoyl dehydrogenase (E3 subunit of both pyruvate dehydrogenase and 2-oxoglutarate dehydrogenase complexes) [Tetrasphaera australiensis Ben110]